MQFVLNYFDIATEKVIALDHSAQRADERPLTDAHGPGGILKRTLFRYKRAWLLLLLPIATLVACGGGGGGSSGDGGNPGGGGGGSITLSLDAPSDSRIDLSWNTPGGSVSVYMIYRNGVYHRISATTSASDTGLSPETQYFYHVSAVDASGTELAQSPEICIRTRAAGIWTTRLKGADMTLQAVASSGMQLIAGGDTGVGQDYVLTSPDGVRWTLSANDPWIPDMNDLVWAGDKYVAVNDFGNIYSSTNGLSWTMRYIGVPSGSLYG